MDVVFVISVFPTLLVALVVSFEILFVPFATFESIVEKYSFFIVLTILSTSFIPDFYNFLLIVSIIL